ncbi:hypothetical protein AMECASPLE_013496 [Ameca splendens]|uniref:Secreted protein n=1 Tax=Ameca splendens TaxID=208324 RepID=A0ABV1A8J0_9TELE
MLLWPLFFFSPFVSVCILLSFVSALCINDCVCVSLLALQTQFNPTTREQRPRSNKAEQSYYKNTEGKLHALMHGDCLPQFFNPSRQQCAPNVTRQSAKAIKCNKLSTRF